MPVSVTLPTGSLQGQFRFTSKLGFSGCEGFVRPGVLMIDGEKRMVQAKSFYKESVDDRGDPFSQDPEKKVRESFDAFKRLEHLGFRVLPFYGMTELDGRPLLLLHDLREGRTIEVYDEKYIHRDAEVENLMGRRSVKSNARKIFNNLANADHIRMELMRTGLLQNAYDVSLGYPGGTAHMITRDPKTNMGDIFVSDVGQFMEGKSKYSRAIDREEVVRVPDAQIVSAFTALLANFHPTANAEALLGQFRSEHGLKRDFMEAAFKSVIGLSLRDFVGGWYKDPEWAKKIFPKNAFPDAMMQAKLHLKRIAQSFDHYTGKKLFDVGREAHDRFMNGADLLLGVDFAYLAALDRRMMHVDSLRKAVDGNGPLPQQDDQPTFAKDGFPAMSFLERFDEPLNERHIVQIRGERDYVLHVELDWESAMNADSSLSRPQIEAGQIKGLSLGEEQVRDFDATKIKVERGPFDFPLLRNDIYYMYEGGLIYRAQ